MTTFAALAVAAALAAAPLPPPGLVNGATAQQLVAAGAVIIDVRTPAEYEAGHIPGARLIPYDQIAARSAELPGKDQPVLLYCRTGRRTGVAAGTLAQLGFRAVYDLQGLSNWPGQVATGMAAK
jgi:rhodanese-related sulfurtransferase